MDEQPTRSELIERVERLEAENDELYSQPNMKAQWWKGFWVAAVGTSLVWFVLFAILFIATERTIKTYRESNTSCQEANRQVQGVLTKCRGVSQGNYDVAIRAQEENRQLRELVSEYQAQIQKGQAPPDLAGFLLKLLL
jgi:hypothetical protein